MNKTILPIILGIFLLTFISASTTDIVQEILSEDVTHLEVTITQDTSEIKLYLDTSETSFNSQTIEYEDITLEGLKISHLLDGFDFKVEYKNGEMYPELTSFHIEDGSQTQLVVDMVLSYLEQNYDVEALNNNLTLAQEYLDDFLTENNWAMYGNGYFEKSGNYYTLFYDKGYGETPSDYDKNVIEILETAIYSITLDEIPKEYLPEELDFDLTASVDISDLEYANGDYEVVVGVNDGTNDYEKTIFLTLQDIEFRKDTFIPDEEILENIDKIEGLIPGTIITLEVLDESPYNLSENLVAHKIFEITADKETEGDIFFNVLKSNITNESNIGLYIWENAWNELSTDLIDEDDNYFYYKAHTPHFSTFLIGEIIEEEEQEDEEEEEEEQDNNSGGGGGSSSSYDDNEDEEEIPETIICTDGELMCSGKSVYVCKDNYWKVKENCLYGCGDGECIEKPININPNENKSNFPYVLFFGLLGGIFIIGLAIIVVLAIRKKKGLKNINGAGFNSFEREEISDSENNENLN